MEPIKTTAMKHGSLPFLFLYAANSSRVPTVYEGQVENTHKQPEKNVNKTKSKSKSYCHPIFGQGKDTVRRNEDGILYNVLSSFYVCTDSTFCSKTMLQHERVFKMDFEQNTVGIY